LQLLFKILNYILELKNPVYYNQKLYIFLPSLRKKLKKQLW
jgi:hypothetical protein